MSHRVVRAGVLIALAVASAIAVSAQVGGKPVIGGNPTPGTTQPDPPNLSDRITLSGCLQRAPKGANATEADANTPSDSRFVLSGAARVEKVPAGTGQSDLAKKAGGGTYRLEGLDSIFSPFVGTKVEISGEVKARAAAEAGGATTSTLIAEFVRRIAARC
ncbi:MAG TPA: hypothetical protein VFO58_21970 [Vicinamibacterales bacterium]|nr:hypothetical protein [Vicinamibacterales bacterium]